ncbi:hypothetical protein FS935_04830 [Metabacillus litoralis]|uniref:DUF2178 domain-containing protein n=1 Tax=Metabacillus litoralis TaxID=152268 RepID=A0A5C6W9A0_9BACI|nr:hypothetical protein [Metabacillus litoralis]TXC92381.1 hypothetical protein FS935_04830 [Metabacillus litoralis]
MKKILQPAFLNINTVILFGWALITLFNTNEQFASVMQNPEPPWEISINMIPILTFFVICIPIAIYLLVISKKKHKSLWKALMLPPELEEADEREQLITANACRSSYIAMWYAVPIAAGLMSFYPLLKGQIPYYPIIILLLIPIVQMISYFYSIQKQQ